MGNFKAKVALIPEDEGDQVQGNDSKEEEGYYLDKRVKTCLQSL